MFQQLFAFGACVAVVGNAWAEPALLPDYLQVQSATEFGEGGGPLPAASWKFGEVHWMVSGPKSTKVLEEHSRKAVEEAAGKVGLDLSSRDDALVVSTTWEATHKMVRTFLAEMSEGERAARCVEKGPDISRVAGGLVGALVGGIGSRQAASMIASGARSGTRGDVQQWQAYDHLAAADRVACGRGEYVLETKVTVTANNGAVTNFLVRSALPGGAMPTEAAKLVAQNADGVARGLKALTSSEPQAHSCSASCNNELASAKGSPSP